jgi:tRNA U34 2-thiouridine synthase MnmA/TrmU
MMSSHGIYSVSIDSHDTDGHCTAQQDLSDAQKVADKLGIKLHTVNFSSDYWDDVFEHFLQSTPPESPTMTLRGVFIYVNLS